MTNIIFTLMRFTQYMRFIMSTMHKISSRFNCHIASSVAAVIGFLFIVQGAYSRNTDICALSRIEESRGKYKSDSAGREIDYSHLPIYFIQNTGQMDTQVRFYEIHNGHTTFFTERGICILTDDGNGGAKNMQVLPIGANKNIKITPEGLQNCKFHYFKGNDVNGWKTGIPVYKSVVYNDIYKDIDVKYYGNNKQLEYDIIVKPGGDPHQVTFALDGICNLIITREGALEMRFGKNIVVQKKPYIYQLVDGKKVEVEGRFRLLNVNNTEHDKKLFAYGFQVQSFDRRHPLIIDPVIVHSTRFGGISYDCGYAIQTDVNGNIYITGETRSPDFPVSSHLQRQNAKENGHSDLFITKLSPSGNELVYSVYIGGSGNDIGSGIAVDKKGNVYSTGLTASTDFPCVSALYKNNAGETDAFIIKLNTEGNLVYSSYLGGSKSEWGKGVAVDIDDNAYVTGWTCSSDFPVTATVHKNETKESQDVFVTKIDMPGNKLAYSVRFGGSNSDAGNGIAVDRAKNTYIAGNTNSPDFPSKSGIYENYGGGYHDAFVSKLNPEGTRFEYSTYLGGNNDDVAHAVAADSSGNVYVTGLTWSSNFPLASPIQKRIAGNNDAFITKLDRAGRKLLYSTYWGGSSFDCGYGIAVNTSGNAYITGATQSDDLQTVQPVYKNRKGGADAFVTKLTPSGGGVLYSTYLGGSSDDVGYGIAADDSGNAYIVGRTGSVDFPAESTKSGGKFGESDVFVVKIGVGKYKVNGYVTDEDRKPLKSVVMKIKNKKVNLPDFVTGAGGYFELDNLDDDSYTISIAKDGYKNRDMKIKINGNNIEKMTVEMKKK